MIHKLHTVSPQNEMTPTAPPPTKQQQAEKFARILTAMASADAGSDDGLIRAFRQQQDNATPATKDGSLSSNDSEQGPLTPTADGGVPAAAEGSGSIISFKPSDPLLLDAYRMLALSPTAPQAMQRPQWSSYDYHVLEKLYTGYASKGKHVLLCWPVL